MADQTETDASVAGLSQKVLVPTNRHNLLEILSAGLIYPVEGYDKHYSDLLSRAPGRIVAVAGRLDDDVCAAVSEEGETSFPVALEIDLARLEEAQVDAWSIAGNADQAALGAEGVAAWAPRAVLPVSAITKIHFRSQADLSEHSAREYENVGHSADAEVSPELFGGTATGAVAWLESLTPPTSTDVKEDLYRGDTYSGVAALTAAALPGETEWLLDWAAGIKAKGRAPKRSEDAPLPQFLATFLAGSKPKSAGEGEFQAVARVLGEQRAEDRWAPQAIPEAVLNELALGGSEEAKGLLTEIEGILRAEKEFRPIDVSRDPPAIAALLLFLLRPDPRELLAWPRDETNADTAVVLTALAYCGIRHGYKRLDRIFKPEGLHSLLTDRAAGRASAPDVLWDWKSPKFAVADVEAEDFAGLALKAGRDVVFARPREVVDVEDVLATAAAADIEPAALEICRLLKWDDCVLTVLTARASRSKAVTVDEAPRIEVALRGYVQPRYKLDVDRFRQRLSEGIDAETLAAAEKLLP